ncbi:MAG: LysM peptidoglycan-binding domain-containing protein [Proteobacteria bacterium]|nr:LysM peptidoglycan-binding domain-containing protein [Pseudomonadota bacterium]
MSLKYRLTTCSLLTFLLLAMEVNAQEAQPAEGAKSQQYSDRIASVQGQNTSYVKSITPNQQPRHSGPRTHLIVDGDTLWDLSATYMSDPMMWPALWSYNPQVTNPHWIYPGDTIFLEPPTQEVAELTVMPEPERPAYVATKVTGRGTIRVPGFYVSELPETRGHILFSDQEKHLLAPGDEVQIDWADIEMRKKVSMGQQFTIFSEGTPVMNEDGDPMAYKLIRMGTLEIIDHRTDTLSTARITQASREIERGNMIIPNDDLLFTVQRTQNSKSLEGRIIDTIDTISQIAAEQYVIINRGTEDGVNPGNRFVIFEQREGLDRLAQGTATQTQYTQDANSQNQNKDDEDDENKDPRDGDIERTDERYWVLGRPPHTPTWPHSKTLDELYKDREYTTDDLPLKKIGEILVIDTRDKFCTGIIVGSTREVGIDTRVVMIKGY